MDIQAKIDELTREHAAVLVHRQQVATAIQQDDANLNRLAGAVAALSGLLAEDEPGEVSPNGTVADEILASVAKDSGG